MKALQHSPEITPDRRAHQAFLIKAAGLQRAVRGAVELAAELDNRIRHLRAALPPTAAVGNTERASLQNLYQQLEAIKVQLNGDGTVRSRNESAPMSIAERSYEIYGPAILNQSTVGAMMRDSYAIAAAEFSGALKRLQALALDLQGFEEALEGLGAPWTPGRVPQWSETD